MSRDLNLAMLTVISDDVQEFLRLFGASSSDASNTAFLRMAASYRSRIAELRPDMWRAFERHYQQHVRLSLCDGDRRQWDAALMISE